jgi:uncharacterized protein YkwD
MRKFKKLFLIFIILLGGIFFFRENILDFYSKLFLRLPRLEKGITDFLIQKTEKQVSTPPPLRAEEEAAEAFLTQAGVIKWTNLQREKYGLPPLKENTKLNASAKLKVEDMFKNQYFAHDSPSGEGVGDLVENVGYKFIAVGENLALGNFQNDEVLLQGWMDSPGHRENILSPNFQEIGVAVAKGIFEGKLTWLAVQHFGLPLSACPQPEEKLKSEIEANQEEIEKLQRTLELLEAEIRTLRPKGGPLYTQKIDEYNSLVIQYNALIEQTKMLINKYNNQIRLFNECLAGVE